MRHQCLPYPHHCLLIILDMVSTVNDNEVTGHSNTICHFTVLLAGTSVTLVFMETDYAL